MFYAIESQNNHFYIQIVKMTIIFSQKCLLRLFTQKSKVGNKINFKTFID